MRLPEVAPKTASRRGWGPIIVLPLSVLLFTPSYWPRWLFMWMLSFAIFAGCKWLTWRQTATSEIPLWRHAGYLLAWPGLDARAFLCSERTPKRPAAREWVAAGVKLTIGAALFWNAVRFTPNDQELLLGWVGMLGLILMLHFGLFHLLSCCWRQTGLDARPLMDKPLASVSVSEFWGRRWNTAFRDLTHRFLYHPLAAKVGSRRAIVVGFVFSGLIHELVISVPAHGGYGGPTFFFSIQALALLGERLPCAKAIGLCHGWRGWIFTMTALGLPLFLLFHPPFVKGIIVPFMRAVGAV